MQFFNENYSQTHLGSHSRIVSVYYQFYYSKQWVLSKLRSGGGGEGNKLFFFIGLGDTSRRHTQFKSHHKRLTLCNCRRVEGDYPHAVWIINQAVHQRLRSRGIPVGSTGQPRAIYHGNHTDKIRPFIRSFKRAYWRYGRRIIEDKMQSLVVQGLQLYKMMLPSVSQ